MNLCRNAAFRRQQAALGNGAPCRPCDGHFHYTMINLKTARAESIPDWMVAKYSN